MRMLILVIILITMIPAAVLAKSEDYFADINADGVMERVTWREHVGGNNTWGNLVISRQKQVIFSTKNLCLAYEGYAITDIDPRTIAKEIVIVSETTIPGLARNSPRLAPSFRSAKIYRYDKRAGSYKLYFLINRTGKAYASGDISGPISDFRSQWPKFAKAIKLAEAKVKQRPKLIRQVPPPSSWELMDSIHDPTWVVITFPNKKEHGIFVVSQSRVESFALKGAETWD